MNQSLVAFAHGALTSLGDVFGRFNSVNGEVNGYLAARTEAANNRRIFSGAKIRCIFDPTDPVPLEAEVTQVASAESKQILEAETLFST